MLVASDHALQQTTNKVEDFAEDVVVIVGVRVMRLVVARRRRRRGASRACCAVGVTTDDGEVCAVGRVHRLND